jgi:hypothetical protein
MGTENEEFYKELRLSHKALNQMSPNQKSWMDYFYRANAPVVKDFLDDLAMHEEYPEAKVEAFTTGLDILIESRVNELLESEENLNDQDKKYLLENWQSSLELFDGITKYFTSAKPSKNTSILEKAIAGDKGKKQEIIEKAKPDLGLQTFMEACDDIALRMAKPEDKQFSALPFMGDLEYLKTLKSAVNPADVLIMINASIRDRELGSDERRGYKRLKHFLEARNFFE